MKPTLSQPFRTHPEVLAICARHLTTIDDVLGPRRFRHLAAARVEIAYWLTDTVGMSSTAIGNLMNRDHSSVLGWLAKRKNGKCETVAGAACDETVPSAA